MPTKYICPIIFYEDKNGKKPAVADLKKFDPNQIAIIKDFLYSLQLKGIESVSSEDITRIKEKISHGLIEIRVLSDKIRIYGAFFNMNVDKDPGPQTLKASGSSHSKTRFNGYKVYVIGHKSAQKRDLERATRLMLEDKNREAQNSKEQTITQDGKYRVSTPNARKRNKQYCRKNIEP